MNAIKIELDDSKTGYTPGETIRGRAAWHLDTLPEFVELRLFWYTSGKGDQDINVVDRVTYRDGAVWGDEAFAFTLPEAPYSFAGRITSLIWALELVAEPTNESFHVQITVSPNGREIDLQAVGLLGAVE